MPQQPMEQPIQQVFNSIQQRSFLNGKSVDSLEVVKAMDIPLDGSISYFPLTDGTAIITKQLQMDGTSRTTIYKPVEELSTSKQIDLSFIEELKEDIKELKESFKSMQEQLKGKDE
jgi:hypothetical protein